MFRILPLLAACTAAAAVSRSLRLVNSCPTDVWFMVTSGAAGSGCNSNADCPPSSSCDLTNHICFWDVPTPSNQGVFKVPAGESNSLTWQVTSNSIVWSGNVVVCADGSCDGPASQCDAGNCAAVDGGPQTRAEFTLSATGTDFYDVSIINGVNVPMAVLAVGPYTPQANNPYWCGSPGNGSSPTHSAPANWSVNPPSPWYTWVVNATGPCGPSSTCSGAGQVCGLAADPGATPRFSLACGLPFGFWTDDQVCGQEPNQGAPFNCAQPVANGPSKASTITTYFLCNDGIASCYQPSAGDNCCGCVNWWDVGVPVPPAPATTACPHVNPEWVKDVEPRLLWLKAACPSCYVFPFDDISSTFTCSAIVNNVNTMNYDVVLCPTAH